MKFKVFCSKWLVQQKTVHTNETPCNKINLNKIKEKDKIIMIYLVENDGVKMIYGHADSIF